MIESGPSDVEATSESTASPRRATAEQMVHIQQRAEKLFELLEEVADGDLVADIVRTSLKLLRDSTNRGDVKLIDRSLAELRYALRVFAPYRDTMKISVFGSARTGAYAQDYQAAADFGAKMAARGWMVTTGAGGGIMAAAHGGAGPEPSFGLAIRLPFEQSTNVHIAGDPKLVNFKYFFTRKLMFVRTSHAIALFPGGFGTMDEGFEVLTLVQTGKSVPMPIVMVDKKDGQFWNAWQHYIEDHLLARGLISPADLRLYKITDDVDQAVEEVCRFYRNYHSLRYMRNALVMRLRTAPTQTQLDEIRRTFADIKTEGDFVVSEALPAEREEKAIRHLPRLVFAFNRRDHGRLRELIDHLNDLA
jgi:hypothetical protein